MAQPKESTQKLYLGKVQAGVRIHSNPQAQTGGKETSTSVHVEINRRTSEYNRGTGCGKTARPGRCVWPSARHSYHSYFEGPLVKIVLMRHGEPNSNLSDKLKMKCSAIELKPLIREYTNSGLNPHSKPTSEAISVSKTCKSVVCSDLRRSIESAKAIEVPRIDLIDSVFRESDLPHAQWRYPKLTLFTWFLFFRAMWFLGYSNNGEQISVAKHRAEIASAILKRLAVEQGSVMLIGHGIFNRLLSKQLRSNGWVGPINPGNNYWEYGVYESNKIYRVAGVGP